MADWSDCIVSYMDLIDIGELINEGNSTGTQEMRRFHEFVQKETQTCLPSHQKVYVWNDSVVLVASRIASEQFAPIMKEVDNFKKKIDKQWKSYAISVKGQLFPAPSARSENAICIYLEVSSHAFSNCFEIEKAAKNHEIEQGPWYVDGRIEKHIDPTASHSKAKIEMLPKRIKRDVYTYNDYLWNDS